MSRSIEPCLCGDPYCKRCFPSGCFYEDDNGNLIDEDGNLVNLNDEDCEDNYKKDKR